MIAMNRADARKRLAHPRDRLTQKNSRPEGRLFVRRPARRVRRAKSRTQKRWIRPTPTPTWLRDDDGDVLKPSPIDAVASMILPPASVLPFAR
ncbi:hypothetical protein BG16_4656 [Burkholderia pseudomallei MSHR2543]|nr:hypothetical protein BG16_4656 [Burkholderia pseudomallei MSHR2543]